MAKNIPLPIIKTIAISVSIIGAGLLGSHLTPEQIKEVKITETKVEIPEKYYKILTEGVADKYDLSQIAEHKKIDISYGNNEAYILIDAWDKKLKELDSLEFIDIDTDDYEKSIVYKMNNYLRNNTEKVK